MAFYGVGLKAYDLLAAWGGFGRSKVVSAREVRRRLPTVQTAGLRGGVVYLDDARAEQLWNCVRDGTVDGYLKQFPGDTVSAPR